MTSPQSEASEKPLALVACWDLSHNPVGRGCVLAELLSSRYRTVLVGPIFDAFGSKVWDPIDHPAAFEIDPYYCRSMADFLQATLDLVLKYSPILVIVSKPRLPSMVIGLLFSVLRNSAIVLDIDDDELSFWEEGGPVTISQALAAVRAGHTDATLPYGETWTRFASSLVSHFACKTVSNKALERKFGGSLVSHARDEAKFSFDPVARARSRQQLGLGHREIAIMFIGTLRKHKGLKRVADAMERLADSRLVLILVGSIKDAQTREDFNSYKVARVKLFPDIPFSTLFQMISAADVVPILQEQDSFISAYQIPAKLSDALAVGVDILATPVEPLLDLIGDGIIIAVNSDLDLDQALRSLRVLEDVPIDLVLLRRATFHGRFGLERNRQVLLDLVASAQSQRSQDVLEASRDILSVLYRGHGLISELDDAAIRTRP